MTDLDLDRLADLRLRLRHTRDPDPALGCAIIALLLPDTIAAATAEAWLARPGPTIGLGLDITGSVEDALRLLGQLGFGPGWAIVHEEPDDGPGTRDDGYHGVWLRHRFFDCLGTGRTLAIALVDVAIHAAALGAAGYEEEEAIPLSAGDGTPRAHDDAAPFVEDALSDDPVERTRQIVGEFWPNLDVRGRLCLKNCDGRFGALDGYELHHGVYRVVDRHEARSTRYDSLEDLLAAGWVLD